MAESDAVSTSPLFSFGLFADVQHGEKDPNLFYGRYFADAGGKLALAVDAFNQSGVPFVVNLGDIIEGNDTDEMTLRDWKVVENALQPLKPKLHSVIGNHCLRLPGPKVDLMNVLNMKANYYVAERIHGFRLVVLDGTEVTVKGNNPDPENFKKAKAWLESHPRGPQWPHAYDWNAGISESQITWLKAEIHSAREAGEKVLVFCHYPIKADAASVEHLLWNFEELNGVLNANGDVVKGYFSGHWHHGGYMQDPSSGIHHLTLRAILEAIPERGPDCENAYAFMDVYADRMVLRGVGWCAGQSREMRFK